MKRVLEPSLKACILRNMRLKLAMESGDLFDYLKMSYVKDLIEKLSNELQITFWRSAVEQMLGFQYLYHDEPNMEPDLHHKPLTANNIEVITISDSDEEYPKTLPIPDNRKKQPNPLK